MRSSLEYEGHWVYRCTNCGRMFYFHGNQAEALDRLRVAITDMNIKLMIDTSHMGYILSRGVKCCDDPELMVV